MAEAFGKKEWIELFRETGLDEAMMEKWHRLFEAQYPESHQNFLEWLNLPASEVTDIRQRFSQ